MIRRTSNPPKAIVFFAALAAVLSGAAAAQASVIIGLPPDASSGNCFPFGCASGTRYQQVYDAGEFPGIMTIGAIEFYADEYTGDTNTLASGTWDLYLSTTPYAVNDIDSRAFDLNLGADLQFFATVTGGVVIPDLWSISGVPFTYNPAFGNLLLDVRASLTASGSLYLNARNGSATGQFSRWHDFGSSFDNWGLVTGFEEAKAPEPATLLLLGSGLVGMALRRRRL